MASSPRSPTHTSDSPRPLTLHRPVPRRIDPPYALQVPSTPRRRSSPHDLGSMESDRKRPVSPFGMSSHIARHSLASCNPSAHRSPPMSAPIEHHMDYTSKPASPTQRTVVPVSPCSPPPFARLHAAAHASQSPPFHLANAPAAGRRSWGDKDTTANAPSRRAVGRARVSRSRMFALGSPNGGDVVRTPPMMPKPSLSRAYSLPAKPVCCTVPSRSAPSLGRLPSTSSTLAAAVAAEVSVEGLLVAPPPIGFDGEMRGCKQVLCKAVSRSTSMSRPGRSRSDSSGGDSSQGSSPIASALYTPYTPAARGNVDDEYCPHSPSSDSGPYYANDSGKLASPLMSPRAEPSASFPLPTGKGGPGSDASGYITFASLNVFEPPTPPPSPGPEVVVPESPIEDKVVGKKSWWSR